VLFQKIEVWIWNFNARSAHTSNNKFIKETPFVCVNRKHLHTCYHYLKAIKCDKSKTNTGYGVTQCIFRAQSSIMVCLKFTNEFYLHGPDLTFYPVTNYFRL
jgi:hypothetical protein